MYQRSDNLRTVVKTIIGLIFLVVIVFVGSSVLFSEDKDLATKEVPVDIEEPTESKPEPEGVKKDDEEKPEPKEIVEPEDIEVDPNPINNENNEELVTPQERPAVINTATLINCTDCTFAPVDKVNQLPSTYNPGGILPQASSAFSSLVADAAANGQSIEVISAFRAYSTQESTFNYWVGVEQSKGLSYADAVNAANTYSAKPGHSEHQLGTTYDVKCVGCIAFDATQNQDLYSYIELNAHKFGFVISYPKNSQNLTGYTYEPWHIRWIGTDLATELFNTGYTGGNGNYLTQFLRNKGY